MHENFIKLKIKGKHLALEPAIIRHEERKALKRGDLYAYSSFRSHRITVLRDESRATFLAYGYLRGKSYKSIENTMPLSQCSESSPILKKMARMVFYYDRQHHSAYLPKESLEIIRSKISLPPQEKRNAILGEIAKYILNEWLNNKD